MKHQWLEAVSPPKHVHPSKGAGLDAFNVLNDRARIPDHSNLEKASYWAQCKLHITVDMGTHNDCYSWRKTQYSRQLQLTMVQWTCTTGGRNKWLIQQNNIAWTTEHYYIRDNRTGISKFFKQTWGTANCLKYLQNTYKTCKNKVACVISKCRIHLSLGLVVKQTIGWSELNLTIILKLWQFCSAHTAHVFRKRPYKVLIPSMSCLGKKKIPYEL